MLEKGTGRRPTLSEVSRETKIHRNVLSNLFKNPLAKITTHDIDRLVKYAFEKLRNKDSPLIHFSTVRKSERELMESIFHTLVAVAPEPPELPKPDELTPEQLERFNKRRSMEFHDQWCSPEIFAQLPRDDIWFWYRRFLASRHEILTGEFPNPDEESDSPLASETRPSLSKK